MKKVFIGIAAAAVCSVLFAGVYFYSQYRFYTADNPAKWEEEILKIEAKTCRATTKGMAVVFIGSSSIKQWESLEKDMAPLPVLNHGFGGSRIQDSTYYVPRLVTAYRPPIVVFYAGDNDIFFRDLLGKKPDTAGRCLEDFKAFAAAVHRDLPAARIFFVAIKPSISRLKYWPQMREANRLIREFCLSDGRLAFIDISAAMLRSGIPDKKYFKSDGLHLNDEGYRLWTSIIKPVLRKDFRGR
jgi:lysophospholipase L1-like esterase